MEKKIYTELVFDIIVYCEQDIVTASNVGDDPYEKPTDPWGNFQA